MPLAYPFSISNFAKRLGCSRSQCVNPPACSSNCIQQLFARDRIDKAFLDRLPRDPLLRSHDRRKRNDKLARGIKLFPIRISSNINLYPIRPYITFATRAATSSRSEISSTDRSRRITSHTSASTVTTPEGLATLAQS
ncbi:MAG TPA: hypothetical protein VFR21_25085 [Bradyrhizobium sp.]|nr:hypothetical protein [Bradyrhizobium sp.]